MSRFDVYGRHPVLEALRAGTVASVAIASEIRDAPIVNDIYREAARQGVPVKSVRRGDLDRALPHRNHQGVAGSQVAFAYSQLNDVLERVDLSHPGIILILDHLEDPGNVGAIIRSADGAGVHGVVLPRDRAAGVTPAVVRASAGATEHVPIVQEPNLVRVMENLKSRGFWCVGLDGSSVETYDTVDIDRPLALIIGGEGSGLSRLVRERCDTLVSIPMQGSVSSLNASVAAAVVLFDISRRRGGAKK